MKKSTSIMVFVTLVLGVAIGILVAFVFLKGPAVKTTPAPTVAEKHPMPTQVAHPAARYPISPEKQTETAPKGEKKAGEKPLPTLNDSDEAMRETLAELYPAGKLASLFIGDHFVQRFVLMVDNLPRHALPINRLPTRAASGNFVTQGEEGHQFISPDNYRRYASFVHFVDALDAKKVVALYAHFYPLFQQAYQQLGYPRGHFNDRLIEVIDHLLATPDAHQPVKVLQHVVRYKYADPSLEKLSAGQKIMIRLGEDNAARIKEKLREIRRELIARAISD